MKSKAQDYMVIDVETSGLPSKTKLATLDIGLCEVAMVMVSPELEIIAEDSFLIKKYKAEYHPKAFEINGLTFDLLENEGIPLKDACDTIIDFIVSYKTAKAKPILVGHNMKGFDLAFIENLFIMHKLDLWKYINNYVIDTLEISHLIYTEAPNYKLGTMCGQFDIEITNAHRALPDTIANAKLWINYLKNLRGENNVSNTEDIKKIEIEIKNFKY